MERILYEQQNLLSILGPHLFTLFFALAFSLKTRKQILARDGNQSAVSGKQGALHAAHINHDKSHPRYDDSSNGRLLTVEEHLADHVNRAGRNGLTIEQNNWAITMLQKLLSGS